MTLAEGIRRHGFRKWYERRLLTGHAHLAFLLLCVLGLMTALEASTRPQPAADRAADIAVILLCVGAGLWALRRYLFLLTHADWPAAHAISIATRLSSRLAPAPAKAEIARHHSGACGRRRQSRSGRR
jgi:hypothetical protein